MALSANNAAISTAVEPPNAAGASRLDHPSAYIVSNGDPRLKRDRAKHPTSRKSGRSGHKRAPWKKLLWVRQDYPDNYTDEATFLDHLQRNPHLKPYEFWPLVSASTVITQHVCAVLIFVSCFAGIIEERISPITVVTTGSLCTVLGWIWWDFWARNKEEDGAGDTAAELQGNADHDSRSTGTSAVSSSSKSDKPDASPSRTDSYNHQRAVTVKSAILIYCALLGLSPILKSLTKSTTSDSIWAISTWLLIINVFFFDYSGGVEIKFPAPLSTNAGIMASTVLASRLTSTTHVFSILLFAIEVFGLFPVFRRYLHHYNWHAHIMLSIALALGAGAGLGVTVTGGGWYAAIVGMLLGAAGMSAVMAACAIWLIGLQKYKNEIHGPWDPARPVTRRRWD